MLQRVVSIGGEPVFFRVRDVGTGEELGLECTLYAESLTDELVYATQDRIRFFLSLDDDLTPFYTLAQGDPIFSEVVQSLHGYHAFKVSDPVRGGVLGAHPAAHAQLLRAPHDEAAYRIVRQEHRG